MLTLPRLRLFHLLTITALFLSACLPTGTVAIPPAPTATLVPPPTTTPFLPATATLPPTATLTPLPTETETITPTPLPVTRRVLILSIDGLRPDAIVQAPMPNL